MATLTDWLVMCASEPEFVRQYNRLNGTNVSFAIPSRSPIESMVDAACGHTPEPKNDPDELHEFFSHCTDLFARIVAHEAAKALAGAQPLKAGGAKAEGV